MSQDQTKTETKTEIKAELGKELSKKGNGNNHTVVWLDGQAPTQHNPEPLSIVGTITAPSIFVKKRATTIDPLKSHALVSVFDGTIKLVVNEKETTAKYTIEGKIKESKRFIQLGINNASGFSSNADEINTAFAHFLGTVIIPDQEKLLKSFNKIVRASGLNVPLEIEQSTILFMEDTTEAVQITEETKIEE